MSSPNKQIANWCLHTVKASYMMNITFVLQLNFQEHAFSRKVTCTSNDRLVMNDRKDLDLTARI